MNYQTRHLSDDPELPPASQPCAPAPHSPLPSVGRDKDEKLWGMACHLSALSAFFIPMGSVLGPLVVWLIKKEEYCFVDEQGKEALNFQLSIFIYSLVLLVPSMFFLFLPLFLLFGIGVVFTIVAAVAANEGRSYRYPFTMRLIK